MPFTREDLQQPTQEAIQSINATIQHLQQNYQLKGDDLETTHNRRHQYIRGTIIPQLDEYREQINRQLLTEESTADSVIQGIHAVLNDARRYLNDSTLTLAETRGNKTFSRLDGPGRIPLLMETAMKTLLTPQNYLDKVTAKKDEREIEAARRAEARHGSGTDSSPARLADCLIKLREHYTKGGILTRSADSAKEQLRTNRHVTGENGYGSFSRAIDALERLINTYRDSLSNNSNDQVRELESMFRVIKEESERYLNAKESDTAHHRRERTTFFPRPSTMQKIVMRREELNNLERNLNTLLSRKGLTATQEDQPLAGAGAPDIDTGAGAFRAPYTT